MKRSKTPSRKKKPKTLELPNEPGELLRETLLTFVRKQFGKKSETAFEYLYESIVLLMEKQAMLPKQDGDLNQEIRKELQISFFRSADQVARMARALVNTFPRNR